MSKRQTHKDWRKRTWPSGLNSTWYKKEYNRRLRRKKLEDLGVGNTYRKYYSHYNINDFK